MKVMGALWQYQERVTYLDYIYVSDHDKTIHCRAPVPRACQEGAPTEQAAVGKDEDAHPWTQVLSHPAMPAENHGLMDHLRSQEVWETGGKVCVRRGFKMRERLVPVHSENSVIRHHIPVNVISCILTANYTF